MGRQNTFYFGEYVATPDRLDQLDEHLAREEAAIRHPRQTKAALRQWLIGGASALHVDWTVSGLFREVADAADVPRTVDGMTAHIARLILPDSCADARELMTEILYLDDPCDIALSLVELQEQAPDAVTALLELRIDDAFDSIDLIADPDARHGIDDLLVPMTKVRAAFIARCLAARIGQEVHAPFGWAPLDHLNPKGPPRLGTILKQAFADLERLERVLALYREGRHAIVRTTDPKLARLFGDDPGLKVTLGVIGRDASAMETRFLRGTDLHMRAVVQQAIWRREHGDCLEDMIEDRIAEIQAKTRQCRNRLESFAGAYDQQGAKHASNLCAIAPLDRLGVIANLLIAWTAERPTGGANDATDNRCGADRYVDWLRGRKSGPQPLPKIYPGHEESSHNMFALLRFVSVDDENMLPEACRRVIDPRTLKQVYLRSQDDAKRVRGRAYSFDELWEGYSTAKTPESEPKLRADALCAHPRRSLPSRKAKALAEIDEAFRTGF